MRCVLGLAVAVVACDETGKVPVAVTLDDGQVLIGGLATEVLVLDGAFGRIEIPLDDVGMVQPVEGDTIGSSHGQIDVWLRNGSELRGSWAEPELALGIAVGGRDVPARVPTDRMQALQLRGGEEWPELDLYRVHTTWGDDFLVDPAQTRISLHNELGEFAPFLSECVSVGPIGAPDGDWRVVLETGTVLIGPLQEAEIAFALPLGPEQIAVPLEALVSLDRGAWGPGPEEDGRLVRDAQRGVPMVSPVTVDAAGADLPEVAEEPPAPRQHAVKQDGWFRNERLEDAKR